MVKNSASNSNNLKHAVAKGFLWAKDMMEQW